MTDELVDVFDESGRPLGTATKRLAHRVGLWHYSMHCWIYRRDPTTGEVKVLVQRRSWDKELHPGQWDISAAGHYQAGETIRDSGREISEELGLSVEYDDLRYVGIQTEVDKVGGLTNREFCRVFLLASELSPHELKPSQHEVSGLVEITTGEGLALWNGEKTVACASGIEYQSGKWVPYRTEITREAFVRRRDFYYLKVFLLVDQAGRGQQYLAI
ncbi:NUDIX hydrolase [Actinophytocola sp.]|uniref:NUDIX hydrolase n=1 Tax=Actinophytocola sp. TaxID=1872138 RepID=UPI00389AA2AE